MSLASLLSIARSALLTHQRALAVTANNVANANTPGYSRQRLDLVQETPLWTTDGLVGRGVTDLGVSRARDRFWDATFRRQSGLLGGSGTLRDALGQIEAAMNEPSDSGIVAALDEFFKAYGDLANDPTSAAGRGMVRQAAIRLVDQLHQLDAQLASVTQNAVEKMRAQVDQANSLLRRIADLNRQIIAARGPNGSAPALEDERDLLVDQLSALVGVRVLDHPDGTITVMAGDTVVVDGATYQTLTLTLLGGGGYGLGLATGGAVNPQSGSLKALSDLTSTTLPGYQAQLDALAQSLVTAVNAVHVWGYNLAGATGTNFFEPAGVTARTIDLAAAIKLSTDNIAAGNTPAPGDGGCALQIAQLARTTLPALGNKTLREFYTAFATTVGTDSLNAAQDMATQLALADNADAQRLSVSGVSVDEEMVNLIGQQQAYQAASRIVKVADELIQDLLRMV